MRLATIDASQIAEFISHQTGLMRTRYRTENFYGRPDWCTRAVVMAGQELQDREGTLRAATFLRSQGIELHVTRRALLSTKCLAKK